MNEEFYNHHVSLGFDIELPTLPLAEMSPQYQKATKTYLLKNLSKNGKLRYFALYFTSKINEVITPLGFGLNIRDVLSVYSELKHTYSINLDFSKFSLDIVLTPEHIHFVKSLYISRLNVKQKIECFHYEKIEEFTAFLHHYLDQKMSFYRNEMKMLKAYSNG